MNWKIATTILALLLISALAGVFYLAKNDMSPGELLATQVEPQVSDNQPIPPAPPSLKPLPTKLESVADSESSNEPVDGWSSKIGNALTDSTTTMRQKSQELLAFVELENASVAQRMEALQHGLNLVSDEHYWDDVLALGISKDLPDQVSETIFADLHRRDPKLLAAVCEEIKEIDGHPFREQAAGVADFINPPVPPEVAEIIKNDNN